MRPICHVLGTFNDHPPLVTSDRWFCSHVITFLIRSRWNYRANRRLLDCIVTLNKQLLMYKISIRLHFLSRFILFLAKIRRSADLWSFDWCFSYERSRIRIRCAQYANPSEPQWRPLYTEWKQILDHQRSWGRCDHCVCENWHINSKTSAWNLCIYCGNGKYPWTLLL